MPKVSLGIVGLPNVGKSTLFEVLTQKKVLIANYPFATIDPNVGVVEVPDERLAKLAAMSHSAKVVPAVVEFYDIAGLVKGANRGEGLGNQFLSHIRECQAVVVVLRVFPDAGVVHVEKTVDPERDLDIINTELVLKDVETVEKRLASLEKEAKAGNKEAVKNLSILKTVREELARNNLLVKFRNEEAVRELQLLSAKPQIYLLNGEKELVSERVLKRIKELQADYIVEDAALADEMPGLVQKAYEILDLISFFTTGEDETRAWTVARGTKAPEAAGVIHTDFEKHFIRAEVVNWEELLEAGSSSAGSGANAWARAREKGFLRLEGKEYVVQDGDVMVIRHGA